ncbi:hypothetical protein CC1G_03251 [Coprinopsis cinerea okayama7|uniref:CoA-binding domain-containing protein n=1 Tax=Coprinopsis cinerea (strain Okayama-7 / 130 / ATCC MYA-4618 / FGSC 9003) TaxID=240176 RepID=A8N7A8_COPC7|nr:hypothetical protein CC1G_03251 [Coprinopsis cinerea okayama7\|eukprot:XP_001830714.1 hypothetical protein CC1G_03251 [Coprinopsis cinerea okayama7\
MSPTTAEIQNKFLSSPYYAVIGASKDQTKYGTKVLKWYQAREYKVTPLHPKESELEGLATLKSVSDLPNPKETSISIVTPPKVTLGALQLAKELDVPALWLQPGAEDEAVIEYIKENLADRVIYGGPCLLVSGDDIAQGLKKSNL